MDSIPKFLASLIVIILGVLLCVSFIVSSVTVNSARTYHSAVIEEIEASHYDAVTIQKCLETAEKDNYSLFIEKMSTSESDPQYFYKVTLQYGLTAPIFGKIHTGTLVGYALSGTHWVEPSVEIPENPETGDVFIYGDYEYRYNMYHISNGAWSKKESQNGWCARVLDDEKTSYEKPLSMIGDTPVVSLAGTYADCANLLVAPEIPGTITSLKGTYWGCTSLSSNINIPSSVTTVDSAFRECDAFITAPIIPEGVTDMTHAFSNCANLTTPANVPSTVKLLSGAFQSCPDLSIIPDNWLTNATNLEGMNNTFYNCPSLPSDLSGFVIPPTVDSAYGMFYECTSLVTAPVIHSNITDIREIFYGCVNLTGTVTINSNPYEQYCENAFKDTVETITLAGDCNEETRGYLIASANNGNVS